ncbi:hypothetical protein P9281_27335 [Caballeronia sp. LP003]|uniref:hypothetical protein n=1 Tax=Caballeronia sp. LP003 TaxID=3038551 RepID=UPI0028642CF7|nr:hypothetical protein [Caballeronia sp. LP003]MDR5790263.1 hypothetical protein [Caballeronia sp. LP003]
MKRIIVMDMKRKYPTLDQIVEDDANPYNVIEAHVVANGGKRYKVGQSSSAYFGRFWVEEKPVTN